MLEPSKPTETKTPFAGSAKLKKPSITRGDLNKALFMGNHYKYAYGKGHNFEADGVSVTLTTRGKTLSVVADIVDTTGKKNVIEMSFREDGDKLKLVSGTSSRDSQKQSLEDPKRLGEALLCIYKHVRTAADKKWAVDSELKTKTREIAGQQLDTGMMPKIIASGSDLQYSAPTAAKDKVCDGNCGKCALKF